MVLLNSSGEVELSFDAGSAKVANVGSKCLMVTETTIGDNNKKTYKTVVKKLDSVKNWSIKLNEQSEETIPLGTEIFDIVNTLKSVGITSSTSDTSVSEEAVKAYQNQDSNEPNYVNVVVNLGGDDTVTLKFNRSAGVITLNDVIEALNANADFIAYATANKPTEEVSGAYKLVANKKKVISPSSKILEDVTIYCTWKEKETSNSDTETDEFTYVKTPGKISKLFVHIGRGVNRNNEFNDYDDMFGDKPTKTLQGFCEGKSSLPLPIYALYKNNFDIAAAKSWLAPYIIQDPNESVSDGEEGSQYVIIDADGLVRQDLIDEYKNSYYNYDRFSKQGFLDDLFNQYESFEYEQHSILNYWPRKVVEENLIKTVVIDVNFNMNNSPEDILNAILGAKNKTGLDDAEINDVNVSSYDENKCSVYVLSSDLLFTRENWGTLNVYNDDRTFAEFWAEESSDKYADESEYRPSASDNWKGVYVIQKAIEEGRALDIYVKKARTND
jgi:hypothetical protein